MATVLELKKELKDLKIPFPDNAKKAELEKILEENTEVVDEESDGEESDENVNDPSDENEQEDEKLEDKEGIEEEQEEKAIKEEDSDYLRQYQYKKGSKGLGHPTSDPDPGSKAEVMKKALLSQEKVTILIQLVDGDDPSVRHSVNLNGYRLDLPKNEYIKLPVQIADLIATSQKQTTSALRKDRIDLKSDKDASILG